MESDYLILNEDEVLKSGGLVRPLSGRRAVKVRRTSRLFSSKAMYVEDQGDFVNGVVEVSLQVRLSGLKDLLANQTLFPRTNRSKRVFPH